MNSDSEPDENKFLFCVCGRHELCCGSDTDESGEYVCECECHSQCAEFFGAGI